MEKRNKRSSEEIDLLYFFGPLLKGVSYGREAATNYLNRLRRNILVFILVFAVVSVAGFSLRYILPKYYKTSASFISLRLPASFYGMQIAQLDNLAGEKNNASLLAGQLHIPENVAGAIKSIEMEPGENNIYLYRNDTSHASSFKVILVMREIIALEQIQQGIFEYLKNNEFSLKRKESRKKKLELLKMNLEEKIRSLDSLKKIASVGILPGKQGQEIVVLGGPVIPLEVYEIQTRYFNELLEINENLNQLEDMEIVQPFFNTAVSTVPDFNKYFKYSILAGLLLALIIAPLTARKR